MSNQQVIKYVADNIGFDEPPLTHGLQRETFLEQAFREFSRVEVKGWSRNMLNKIDEIKARRSKRWKRD